MKWIALVIGGLVAVVAFVAGVGSLLPRTHTASRTLRVGRSPVDVWPVIMRVTQASDVPVDVLDSQPPHRLVTRVSEKEKNFGGTWTIDVVSKSESSAPAATEVTVTEDGWVANPIFRFVSRVMIGHHATLDGMLKQVAKELNQEAVLSGE